MSRRILHVVTNRGHSDDPGHSTGLWLPELAHAWDIFEAEGHVQTIVSPAGGRSPVDPRALKWPFLDVSTKGWLNDPSRVALLEQTAAPADIDPDTYDAIYFAGGHGAMWDFPDSIGLQAITRHVWERGAIVSAVCHGYCGLLNTRLSDGKLLVANRHITGFSWAEETLAGVASRMPFDAEAEMKRRGALYDKALLPFVSHVVIDGQMVTGQNPRSAKETARQVAGFLRN